MEDGDRSSTNWDGGPVHTSFPSSLLLDLGMGVIFTRCKKQLQQNGTAGSGGSSGGEEEMENGVGEGAAEHIVRAIYGFNGSNEDEVCV